MPNPRLASRYAKSIIDLSLEQGLLEKVYNDMLLLQSIIKGSREFVGVLRSPIISADKKNKIIEAIVANKISPLTAAFIKLLVSKGREESLPEITTSFISQYKTYKNIQIVKLTTAAPVSEEVKNAIIGQVKKSGAYENIELETSVNENLIGGFTLQVGDKLVDASIANNLREISREFENNDFVYKLK